MSTDGIATRPYLRETLLALLVLALTFLNFGHVAVSASGQFSITPDSWCGDPMAPGGLDHPPCHACRIGNGADLPPPPAAIEPIAFTSADVVYAAPMVAIDRQAHLRPAQPRGPPALV